MLSLPLIVYVLTTALGLVLIKLGSATQGIVELIDGRIVLHPTVLNVTGVILYGISFILYTYLVSKNDLGYIIPVTTALVYVLVFVASFAVFKEPFSPIKILAIALIIAGVILLNLKK